MTDTTKAARDLIDELGILDMASNMQLTLDDFQYQGFQPLVLMEILMKLSHDKKISKEEFKKDLMTMAVIGTFRGSNLEKIKKKSSAQLRDFLAYCQTSYGLQAKPQNSNATVTLARIAAMMARQVSSGYYRQVLRLPTVVDMTVVMPGMAVPRALCLSTFGSLIPQNTLPVDQKDLLIHAFCLHQYHFDRVIAPQRAPDSAAVMQYVLIQMRSNLYSEEDRVQHCEAVGLIVANRTTSGSQHTLVNVQVLMAMSEKFLQL